MRAARNFQLPVLSFSLSSFVLVFLAIPVLVVLLIILPHPSSTSSSSSSTSSETWRVGDSSGTSSSASINKSLAYSSAAQEWPQPPAEAPDVFTSFLYGTPSPSPASSPAPKISTKGGTQVGGNRRVRSWRSRKLDKLEASLRTARSSIREAAAATSLFTLKRNTINSTSNTVEVGQHDADRDYVPHGRIYRNARAFHRYIENFWQSGTVTQKIQLCA